MLKKKMTHFVIIVLVLFSASTMAFAETSTPWSDSYSGVQFKYINKFDGSDWDTLRWHNANVYKVAITYTIRLNNGSTSDNLIYVRAGQTTSESDGDSALAPGARVVMISVKSVQ